MAALLAGLAAAIGVLALLTRGVLTTLLAAVTLIFLAAVLTAALVLATLRLWLPCPDCCHKSHFRSSSLRLTESSRLISCLYERYATQFRLKQPVIEAFMTTVAMPRRRQDIENAEYRQRMLVNALAASFITLLIVTGYWVVTTLTGVI